MKRASIPWSWLLVALGLFALGSALAGDAWGRAAVARLRNQSESATSILYAASTTSIRSSVAVTIRSLASG